MSWWETGFGEDVIGDEPADAMREALLTATRSPTVGQLPSLKGLLNAVGKVIYTYGAEFLDSRGPDGDASLAAVLEGRPEMVVRIADARANDSQVQVLRQGFNVAAIPYHNRFGRPPRPSEFVSLLSFVVQPQLHDFVSDGAGLQLRSLQYRAPST